MPTTTTAVPIPTSLPKPTTNSPKNLPTIPVLLGKQQHWGLHPKTTDEARVQTTLLNEANLCRQTVATGSGNVVSMTPMKVFQTDVSFPERT